MKILSPPQLKQADACTIKEENIHAHELMERAALVFSQWLHSKITSDKSLLVICGTGNNGGDGLCIARHLYLKGYKIRVGILPVSTPTPEFEINLRRIKKYAIPLFYFNETNGIEVNNCDIIIDAIFGTGISREINGLPSEIIGAINASEKLIYSVDVPSGLIAEGPTLGSCVQADCCLTFQSPKLGFLFQENYKFVKSWEMKSIGLSTAYIQSIECQNHLITAVEIKQFVCKRNQFTHKGNLGHALIIAGSGSMKGAALLCGNAALHAGCGLVTIANNQPVFSYPELMFTSTENLSAFIQNKKIKSIGIGPGLGVSVQTEELLHEIFQQINIPLVIDADGLNTIALNPELIKDIPVNSILTPHPLEFEKLFGISQNAFERLEKQKHFSKTRQIIIIYKTAYTCITMPDGTAWFNSTGNPALATAGSGDVLTGIISSLLAQGYKSEQAALSGVYLHGFAADIAIQELAQDKLIASNIIEFIPKAFYQINT